MAAITRLGLGGSSAAYPGFADKAAADASMAAAYMASDEFFVATFTSLYFEVD